MLQVNFNNYNNSNVKRINKFVLLDIDDKNNKLSENMKIMNIDIASSYEYLYNNKKEEKEISNLERIAAMIYCETLEDISYVLKDKIFNMEEKNKLLNNIKDVSSDKDVLKAVKLEDNIDYRFEAVLEQEIEQGREESTKSNIINMLKENIKVDVISKINGKNIEDINKIAKGIK